MARLPTLRSIHAVETDAHLANIDSIAVHHIGPAHDVTGKCGRGEQEQGGEEEFHARILPCLASRSQ